MSLYYKIILYNPRTEETSVLAEMPERRMELNRPKGKPTIIKWLKCIFGEEWYLQNKNLIGITKHNRRRGEIR